MLAALIAVSCPKRRWTHSRPRRRRDPIFNVIDDQGAGMGKLGHDRDQALERCDVRPQGIKEDEPEDRAPMFALPVEQVPYRPVHHLGDDAGRDGFAFFTREGTQGGPGHDAGKESGQGAINPGGIAIDKVFELEQVSVSQKLSAAAAGNAFSSEAAFNRSDPLPDGPGQTEDRDFLFVAQRLEPEGSVEVRRFERPFDGMTDRRPRALPGAFRDAAKIPEGADVAAPIPSHGLANQDVPGLPVQMFHENPIRSVVKVEAEPIPAEDAPSGRAGDQPVIAAPLMIEPGRSEPNAGPCLRVRRGKVR